MARQAPSGRVSRRVFFTANNLHTIGHTVGRTRTAPRLCRPWYVPRRVGVTLDRSEQVDTCSSVLRRRRRRSENSGSFQRLETGWLGGQFLGNRLASSEGAVSNTQLLTV